MHSISRSLMQVEKAHRKLSSKLLCFMRSPAAYRAAGAGGEVVLSAEPPRRLGLNKSGSRRLGVHAVERSGARGVVRVTRRFGVAPLLPVVGGVKCNAFGTRS